MTSRTGTTVAGMQTEDVMIAAVDTTAKAEAPELMTGIGAADMTTMITRVVTESMILEPGTAERSAETGVSCVINAPGKIQAGEKEGEKTEAEIIAALERATAASQAPPAIPRKARLTLNGSYLAIQR